MIIGFLGGHLMIIGFTPRREASARLAQRQNVEKTASSICSGAITTLSRLLDELLLHEV